jgi:hypothetical protein
MEYPFLTVESHSIVLKDVYVITDLIVMSVLFICGLSVVQPTGSTRSGEAITETSLGADFTVNCPLCILPFASLAMT